MALIKEGGDAEMNYNIFRKQFMAAIKEGVKAEVNAKKILFYKWDEQRA